MPNSKSKPPAFIPGKGFHALVKSIKDGKLKFIKAVKKLTGEYYWSLGDGIHKHILESKDRADYGKYVYQQLEKETEIEESTLYRCVQFRLAYPILVGRQELSWDVYRKLITVSDKNERETLEKLVIENGWSGERLQEYLNTKRKIAQIKDTDAAIPQLKCERGTLYTYQIIERPTLDSKSGKYVDSGFHRWTDIKSASRFEAGDVVESLKSEDGQYSLKKTSAGLEDLYTFKASVERVVDGDTQWGIVDCGFSSWQRSEFRLRGIDCPELSTKEGQAAKRFVEERLKPCKFIIIKSYKTEKWGRYLADIFYKPGEKDPYKVASEGVLLNQELLDNRLAVVWKG